jgi:hypothetical protein
MSGGLIAITSKRASDPAARRPVACSFQHRHRATLGALLFAVVFMPHSEIVSSYPSLLVILVRTVGHVLVPVPP